MSKTNDLIRLASRLEKKLAQQDLYNRYTPAVKKMVSDLSSVLKRVVASLANNEQAQSLDSFTALKGVSANVEGWLSLDEIPMNEYLNVTNLWDKAEGLNLLDQNSKTWIGNQIYSIGQQLGHV